MYFTIKLVKFILRWVVKVVLLPVTIVKRAIGMGSSTEEPYWVDEDAETADAGTGASSGGTTGGSTTATVGGSQSASSTTFLGIESPFSPREQLRNTFGMIAVLGAIGGFLFHDMVKSAIGESPPFEVTAGIFAPVILGALVWYGLNQRRRWAWYLTIIWNALLVVPYFIHEFPWWLTAWSIGFWYFIEEFLFMPDILILVLGAAIFWQVVQTAPDDLRGGGTPSTSTSPGSTGTPSSTPVPSGSSQSSTAGSGTGGSTASDPGSTDESAAASLSADVDRASTSERPGSSDGKSEMVDGVDGRTDDETGDSGEASAQTTGPGSAGSQSSGSTREAAETDDEPPPSQRVADDTEASIGEEAPTIESLDSTHVEGLTASDVDARVTAVEELASAVVDGSVDADVAVRGLETHAVEDDAPAVREAACDALGDAGTPAARSLLEDLRLDPDGDVSRTATRQLRTMEDH